MGLVMECHKNRLIITSHLTHGIDAGKRLTNHKKYTGILDRFLKDARYRESQQKLG